MRIHLALVALLVAAGMSCQARQLLQAAPGAEEAPLLTRVGVWKGNVFPLLYQSDGQYVGGLP